MRLRSKTCSSHRAAQQRAALAIHARSSAETASLPCGSVLPACTQADVHGTSKRLRLPLCAHFLFRMRYECVGARHSCSGSTSGFFGSVYPKRNRKGLHTAANTPGTSQTTYTTATQMRIFMRTPTLVELALGFTLRTTEGGWEGGWRREGWMWREETIMREGSDTGETCAWHSRQPERVHATLPLRRALSGLPPPHD